MTKRWTYNKKTPTPKPGGMPVQGGSLSHHSLLLLDAAASDDYLVLNGKADYQSIDIKPIKRASVIAIYSLEDFTRSV